MAIHCILDHGATGDGQTNDAPFIQAAIDACAAAGGGTVLLPAGHTFLAGSFELKSNIEFCVERGAVLKSAHLKEDFPLLVFTTGAEAGKRLWIGGKHLENVAITGGGVIDGSCHAFSLEEGDFIHTETHRWRPAMTCFEACRNFTVRDVTLINAANWALHFTGCEDVVVEGIRILNDLKFPNCDGIDPDHCRNVRISNCHIEAADDCIVLKNTRAFDQYGPTENVTVTNCTLISTSSAIKIGTESVDDFRNLVFSNCVIQKSHRGLSIHLRDAGNVENVIFSNMTVETRRFHESWWGAAEAIYVTAVPRSASSRSGDSKDDEIVGRIRNVLFTNIFCRSENGIFLYGSAADRIENVTFDNVRLEIYSESRWPSGRYDLRPCEPDLHPTGGVPSGKSNPWGCKTGRDTPAVFLEQATRITLRNCAVDWAGQLPDTYTKALEEYGVESLTLENFTGADRR
ncbi:MAG: glycoside hydrolase family 28 protein [Opitutales bacterium]